MPNVTAGAAANHFEIDSQLLQLMSCSSPSNDDSRARQNDSDLGEFAGLRVNLDGPRMLLDDDIVADRQAKPGAFASRLGGEEGVEYLVLYVGWNTRAVIAYPDFDPIP